MFDDAFNDTRLRNRHIGARKQMLSGPLSEVRAACVVGGRAVRGTFV